MNQMYNAHEIFEIGIDIEKNGQEFYQEAAESMSDPDMKKFFKELANWEKSHVNLFSKLKSELPNDNLPPDTDPENQYNAYLKATADSHIFIKNTDMKALVKTCNDPVDVLNMALRFEKDSVVLYVTMKGVVPKHLGQDKIEAIINEEIRHVHIISSQIDRLV